MALVFLLFPFIHAGLQEIIVEGGRFKAQFPGFQHLRAQPRPDELLRRHSVVGEKAQGGEGGRAQDADPGHGFRTRHRVSSENTAPRQRPPPEQKK